MKRKPNDSDDGSASSSIPDDVGHRERHRRRRIRGVIGDDDPPEEPQQEWMQLSGFKRDLLQTIKGIEADGKTPTGPEIRCRLEPSYDCEINNGRLYQNLDTLRTNGFIRKLPVDGRTNAYYLREGTARMLHEVGREFLEICEIPVEAESSEG